ncbi:hypothetical protein GCM10017602_12060 [Herbiconiux flava]|nr:hypothetical protein GCM10017602_12060 [Herbiconiux flava]
MHNERKGRTQGHPCIRPSAPCREPEPPRPLYGDRFSIPTRPRQGASDTVAPNREAPGLARPRAKRAAAARAPGATQSHRALKPAASEWVIPR